MICVYVVCQVGCFLYLHECVFVYTWGECMWDVCACVYIYMCVWVYSWMQDMYRCVQACVPVARHSADVFMVLVSHIWVWICGAQCGAVGHPGGLKVPFSRRSQTWLHGLHLLHPASS